MSLRGAATRLSLKTPLEDGTHFPDEQRVILYDCTLMLTEEEVTVARANLMELLYQGNKVIFNQTLVDHPGNDNLRRQKKLNKRSIKAREFLITLKQKLDGIAKGINREWQCNGMSLLYSLPGCQRQLQHTDGVHGCDTGFASCLYTLDNSVLPYYYYPFSRKLGPFKCGCHFSIVVVHVSPLWKYMCLHTKNGCCPQEEEDQASPLSLLLVSFSRLKKYDCLRGESWFIIIAISVVKLVVCLCKKEAVWLDVLFLRLEGWHICHAMVDLKFR